MYANADECTAGMCAMWKCERTCSSLRIPFNRDMHRSAVHVYIYITPYTHKNTSAEGSISR
ncbi:hypothetical protein X777_13307 [Ooceraea biroi]|uniref:Uncharacterized protein n=1 Tax=Ooceraea biroi TaxID=2015173 RepID=A0A026WYL0_OOCBI|nr:hypothetical protein X777_13307 [Ooceraea biroi]